MLQWFRNLFVWKYRIQRDGFWQIYVPQRTFALSPYWFDLYENKVFTTLEEAEAHLEAFKNSDESKSSPGFFDVMRAKREAALYKRLNNH